jgi:hypothetical protein
MSKLAENLKDTNSTFATFLRDSKIDPARVLSVSHRLESLRPEDREIKRAKQAAAGKEDEASKAARAKKPRSGRPVTKRLLRAAMKGEVISGPAKHRLLRAINALRVQKKQSETDLRTLFPGVKKAAKAEA